MNIRCSITNMSAEEATLVTKWKYPKGYELYNFAEGTNDYYEILSNETRSKYKALKINDELVGYLFIEKRNIYGEVEVGMGLAPNMLSNGVGSIFLAMYLNSLKTIDYPLIAWVACFNKRAQAILRKFKFKKYCKSNLIIDGVTGDFYKYKLESKEFHV